MLRIDNIKIYEDLSVDEVISKVLTKNKVLVSDVIDVHVVKKSIDARDKRNIFYNYAIDLKVKDEKKYSYLKSIEEVKYEEINIKRNSDDRPIIIGAGPAGLFCALMLVDNGFKPIIIEQGSKVEDRIKKIDDYKNNRNHDSLTNVQFGEGGAGTFSDGKLTTGISSIYIKMVLEYFYKFGAPEEILYLNKPHIGTDNLRLIIKNIREYILSKGGTYYFDTKFLDYKKENGVFKVLTSNGEFETDSLVLAIGHSARDTYKLLCDKKINLARKNFSVGVRIEHKQDMINKSQYGDFTKLKLPQAEYKLVHHASNGRTCYTFCMCPGGEVVASSSEEDAIVTNGMSYFKRDLDNANSALLVNVLTTDFPGDDPLAGVKFQRELEHKAFLLGGSNGNAPIQKVGDFIDNKVSTSIGNVIPTYKPGYTLSNLNEILPSFVSETLKEGIIAFDRKIKGFASSDAIITGVETRSSAPITILRNELLESSEEGLYPCGEGAGYAGGITSSAVDGIKAAIKIMEKE